MISLSEWFESFISGYLQSGDVRDGYDPAQTQHLSKHLMGQQGKWHLYKKPMIAESKPINAPKWGRTTTVTKSSVTTVKSTPSAAPTPKTQTIQGADIKSVLYAPDSRGRAPKVQDTFLRLHPSARLNASGNNKR
jgi:hypothetical protein